MWHGVVVGILSFHSGRPTFDLYPSIFCSSSSCMQDFKNSSDQKASLIFNQLLISGFNRIVTYSIGGHKKLTKIYQSSQRQQNKIFCNSAVLFMIHLTQRLFKNHVLKTKNFEKYLINCNNQIQQKSFTMSKLKDDKEVWMKIDNLKCASIQPK